MQDNIFKSISYLNPEPVENIQVKKDQFRKEMSELLRKYSDMYTSETPSYILVEYILNSLDNFDKMSKARDHWFKK